MKEFKAKCGTIFYVSKEDYVLVDRHTWHIMKDKKRKVLYVRTNLKMPNGRFKGKLLHRMIMGVNGKEIIDHIDQNGLNNRRSNLRMCTHAQNIRNSTQKKSNSTSKYKGVCWSKKKKKWVAQITFNYKTRNIGSFSDETIAAMAYNNEAKKLFGDFAYLNNIDSLYGEIKARLASESAINIFPDK